MHLSISVPPLALLVGMLSIGCIVDDDPETLQAATEELSLVDCRQDSDCARDQFCWINFDDRANSDSGVCSNGVRCSSTRECDTGYVCRGADGYHCVALDRDDPVRDECPRGSVHGYVSCAPGFEAIVVSREPHCETCEPLPSVIDRCRLAGFTIDECRRIVGQGDGIDSSPDDLLRRCLNADYTEEQCRRLLLD